MEKNWAQTQFVEMHQGKKRFKINMSTLGNLKDFIYDTAITDW